MKKNNVIHLKIEFEQFPIIDTKLKNIDEAYEAFEMVRKKLK